MKNFTFYLDPETIEKMKKQIKQSHPKFRSQAHFVETAIYELIEKEKKNG